MIKNWSEIQERYDAIKDHKPRASKKLNELGEILSSAYMIDPDKADQMWQYIVDLNVADDIAFSKFYIAQVFNKLTDRMKPEDATAFVAMNPERLQMMIMYGYDGGTLWRCLDTLMRGYIASDDINGAMVCVGYFYDKFGGINSGYPDISKVAGNVAKVCAEHISRKDHADTAAELLTELGESENDDVNTYVEIVKAINGIGGPFDYEELLDSALENRHPTEFFDLLWAARNDLDEENLRDKWVEYVQNCDENEELPHDYFSEDVENYNKSKLKFYVDLEKETDTLLERYFNRSFLYDVEKGIIWSWIECEDWERFTKYIAQLIMNIPEGSFEKAIIKYELDNYMDEMMSEYHTDRYNRSYKKLIEEHGNGFMNALAKISAMTVGCSVHESYHEYIKNYIQQQCGNLEPLKTFGFDDEVETRSAEERLKEYVLDFLMSGNKIHEPFSTKYTLIEEARKEELNELLWKKEEDGNDSSNDPELEMDYRLALDDNIAAFYFLHFPRAYTRRKDLISACVRKGDINRAIELIDMMADTKNNKGYEDLNGWGRQNMLTLKYLIDEYSFDDEDRWDVKEDITDEKREIVKQLVYRMLPHLSKSSAKELQEKWLYKIDPQSVETDDYIVNLLKDAEIYTTFPKPRGTGGAPNINRMTDELMSCFSRLAEMNRLDVIGVIMEKFANVKDILKPVPFSSWMSCMAQDLQNSELISFFKQNKGVFEAWLDDKALRDSDILTVAHSIADGCTHTEFMDFRNFVIARRGKVKGLDACYQKTSDNTEGQELFIGNTVQIDLGHIEIIGENPVASVEIHLMSTAKTHKLDSVRIVRCEINGIETKDCGFGFFSELDGEPPIGYRLIHTNEKQEDELTIYSDFLEDNDIDEVNRIALSFVIMDKSISAIEETSEAIIELDDETGEYKVVQIAESKNCSLTADNNENRDSDSSDDNVFKDEDVKSSEGTSQDITDLVMKLLQSKLDGNNW